MEEQLPPPPASKKQLASTYCMERVPGGLNLIGRTCHNQIRIEETMCESCKERKKREEDQ